MSSVLWVQGIILDAPVEPEVWAKKTTLSAVSRFFPKEMPHNTQVQDSEFKSVKGRLTLPPQKGSEGKLTQA